MIPTFDVEELRALQLERLRDTLTRVHEHVPHYRRAFDEAGVHPSEVTSLADLARLPFTTKEDLRRNYPFGMFAVPRTEVVRGAVRVPSGEVTQRARNPRGRGPPWRSSGWRW